MARIKRVETMILTTEDKQLLFKARDIAGEIFGSALGGSKLENVARDLRDSINDFINMATEEEEG